MSTSRKGIAIVTGAAQGIGKAIALRLASDGYDIALNDLPTELGRLKDVQTLVGSLGRRAIAEVGDVSDENTVKDLVDKCVVALGGLDVMVANAGTCPVGPFLDTDVSQLDRALAVNVRSTFLCYQYAAKQMVKQGRGGRLIGASSSAGKQGVPIMSSYCASKFGVRGLTQAIAGELGPHGITVNAYAPGAVDTVMVRGAARNIGDEDGIMQMNIDKGDVGFLGQPDDVAGLVSYISSKESRYITGQTICINGGWFYD